MDHRGNTAPIGVVMMVMLTAIISGAVVVNAIQTVEQETDQRREDVEQVLSTERELEQATPHNSTEGTAICRGGERDSSEGQGERCETATS